MPSDLTNQKQNVAPTSTSETTQLLPVGLAVKVPQPAENQAISINSSPDGSLNFEFDPTQDTNMERVDNNLVFTQDNGGSVTVVDFFVVGNAALPTLTLPDGAEVPLDFLTAAGIDISTAAGPSASVDGSGTSYTDDTGTLLGGIDRLGSLGTDQWARATSINEVSLNNLIAPAGDYTLGVTSSSSAFAVPIAAVYEDAQPHQNIGDSSLSAGRFSLALNPATGSTVGEITISGLPQGAQLYLGDPASGGNLLNPIGGTHIFTANDFASPGVYIIPPTDSDADFNIDVSVVFNASGGSTTVSVVGTIVVDAVADQPINMALTSGNVVPGDVIITDTGLNQTQEFENGWAKDKLTSDTLPENKTVALTVTGTFGDFADGSEEHYVLVNLPTGFVMPTGSPYAVVQVHVNLAGEPVYPDGNGNWPAGSTPVNYYKIPVSNADLVANNGDFTLNLNVVATTNTTEGQHEINVLLGAEEVNPSGQELDLSNNIAFAEGSTNVDVNFFNADLTIKAGWVYEGNVNGSSPTEVAEGGPTAGLGAPISFDFVAAGGEVITLVTLEIDPAIGVLYSTATDSPITNSSGLVSLNLNDLTAMPPTIFFRPNAGNLNDGDVELKYTLNVSDNGATYKITGSVPVVIDAVAQAATMDSSSVIHDVNDASHSAAVSGSVVNLALTNVVFKADSSENQYIVIEKGDYLDSLGSPLPSGMVQLTDSTDLANFKAATGIDATGKFVLQIDPAQFSANSSIPIKIGTSSSDHDAIIKITTVTVEGNGAGNDKSQWTGDHEYDFTNNVATSDHTATLKISEVDGAWALTTTNAYEADSSNAHLGSGVDANATTTGTITLAMPTTDSNAGHEVVTSFTLTCNADLVDGTIGNLLVNTTSGWVLLTPTVADGIATYDLSIVAAGQTNIQLRYSPGADSDNDLNFTWKATVTEKESGATAEKSGSGTIVVDAVADKPTGVTDGTEEVATFASTIEVALTATFKDFTDGSESHYLLVEVPVGLSIDTTSLSGVTYVALTLTDIAAINSLQPGTLDANGTYYKIDVPNSGLVGTNGVFSIDVIFNTPSKADAGGYHDPSTGNYTFDGKVIAWAQENATGTTEISTDNNNSFTSGDFGVVITTLGEITVSAENTYEGLDPNKHGGTLVPEGTPSDYGLIKVAYDTQYESLTNFELVFTDHGFTNGATIEQWDGTNWVTLTFSATSPYTITIATYDPTQPIRYNPGNQSDADVKFTWSGVLTDTNDSSQTTNVGSKPGESVTLIVDAVADKPDLAFDATRDGDVLTLDVKAQFYDLDGSETHTLTIDVPFGLTPTDYTDWTLSGTGTEADPYQLTKNVVSADGKDDTTLKFDITTDYNTFTKPPLTINADAKEAANITTPDTEITNVNNEANANESITIPEFSTGDGAFKGLNSDSFEDSRPHHNLESGQDSKVDGPRLFEGNTATATEFVSKVSVELVDANGDSVGGKLIYDDGKGNPFEVEIDPTTGKATITFTQEDGFDSKFLTFQPQGHYSGTISIDSTIVVTAADTGVTTVMDPITSNVAVDAVATLSGEFVGGEAVNGVGTEVEISFSTSFEDNDGSEQHYVLFQIPKGWPVLTGLPTEMYNLGDGSKLCYVIDATTSKDFGNDIKVTVNSDGTVDVTMTLTRPDGATSETFKVGTLVEERNIDYNSENLATDYWNNNIALRPGEDILWNINTPKPGVEIDAKEWIYEGDTTVITVAITDIEQSEITDITFTFTDANGVALTGSIEYIGTDGQTHTANLDNGGTVTLSDYSSVKVDVNGNPILGTDGKTIDNSITYKPDATSDADITVKVELNTPDNTFTDGDVINVDAVANEAIFSGSDPHINGNNIRPGGPAFVMKDLTINFPDTDGSEVHSLLLEVKTGWTYTIGGKELTAADLVVVNGKTYFKVDLDGSDAPTNDITWQGNVAHVDISVKLSEFAEAEAKIKFEYGGMSEEANVTDNEFTTDNNVAIKFVDYGDNPKDPDTGEPTDPGTGNPGTIHPPTTPGGGDENGGTLVVKGYVYEVPSSETPNSADVTITKGTTALTIDGIDSGTLTITYKDGSSHIFTSGSSAYTVDMDKDPIITFTPNADYSDTDVKINYTATGKDGNSAGHFVTVVVDAVAQAPENISGEADYTGSHTAVENNGVFEIDVTVDFKDQDASTTNYVLVEAKAGWECEDTHETMYVNGTLYFRVEADATNTNGNVVTVNLKAPEVSGNQLTNGLYEQDFKLGAVSIDNATDKEVQLGNNIAITEAGTAHVVVSPVDSNITLGFSGHGYEDNLAGYESDGFGHGNAIAGTPVDLGFKGLSATDSITNLEISFDASVGSLTLNGTPLTSGYTDSNLTVSTDNSGNLVITFTNYDPSTDKLAFTPAPGISFNDVTFNWKADVVDSNSGETQAQDDSSILLIDAVAHKPEVTADAKYNGLQEAAKPGETVDIPLSVTFTQAGSEAGYIFIEQVAGWQIMDLKDMNFTIVPKDGTPANGFVYRISVKDLPSDFTSTDNGDGTYTVKGTFTLKAPEGTTLGEKITPIEVGGIVLESATGGATGDKEVELENNRVISSEQIDLVVGPIGTPQINVSITPITEDTLNGGEITLNVQVKDNIFENADTNATRHDEIITETTLTFSAKEGSMDMMGTVIYDGKAYSIDTDGKVTIDFGTNGYDNAKEFYVVWGTVETEDDDVTVKLGSDNKPIITDWNHSAGNVNVNSSSKVVDTESLAEGMSNGGGTVNVAPNADAPETVTGVGPTGAVATTETVEITVNATFADIDGSEKHFILVEAKTGWGCQNSGYTINTIDGIKYFIIEVSSTDPNPSLTVFLTPPTTIGNGSSVDFKVGGYTEDGTSTSSTISDTPVNVTLDGVTATGATVSGACAEDGSAVLTFTVKDGAAGDSISEVTFKLATGQSITGSDGSTHTGTFTLSKSELANNTYSYHPKENVSGTLDLNFDAKVSSSTDVTVNFPGQSGSVVVSAVVDQPDTVTDSSGATTAVAGHEGKITATLSANFADTDGSEQHFFLVQLPAGVLPPAEATLVSPDPTGLFSGPGAIYKIVVGNSAAQSIDTSFTMTQGYNGGTITVVAGSTENATGDTAYSDASGTVTINGSATDLNIAPVADDVQATLDSLRGTTKNGSITLNDADGDTVTVTGVTGGTSGNNGTQNYFEVAGNYGVLTMYADGTYAYVLNQGQSPLTASETFTYEVSDGWNGSGAMDTGTITIDLTNANTDPTVGGTLTGSVGGLSNSFDGTVTWGDSDGDAVTFSITGESGTPQQLSANAITIDGTYGTLTVNPDGSYSYQLKAEYEHESGVKDSFTLTATDIYGATQSKDLEVNVAPVNHAPDAQNVIIGYPTNGVTYTNGTINLAGFDEDTSHSVNNDTVILTHVNGQAVPTTDGLTLSGLHGSLIITATGAWTYILHPGVVPSDVNSVDTFSFTVKDSFDLSSDANFYITLGSGVAPTSAPMVPFSTPLATGFDVADTAHMVTDPTITPELDGKNVATPFEAETTVEETSGYAVTELTSPTITVGEGDNNIIFSCEDDNLIYGGAEQPTLRGTPDADTFAWSSEHSDANITNTVIGFNTAQGDKLSFFDLFGDVSNASIMQDSGDTFRITNSDGNILEAIFAENDILINIRDSDSNILQSVEVQMTGNYTTPVDVDSAQQMLEQMIKACSGAN